MIPIVTWNVGNQANDRLFKALVALMLNSGVINLQETGDREHTIDLACSQRNWKHFFGDMEGSNSVAQLYDPAQFKPDRVWSFLGAESRRVEPGPGPEVTKQKVTNAMREGNLVIMNCHKIAGSMGEGVPKRKVVYREHVDANVNVVRRHQEKNRNVILTMDANAVPEYDLLDPYRNKHLRWVRTPPTIGDRHYDQFWISSGLQVVSKRVLDGFASDHKPVRVVLEEKDDT